MIEKSEKLYTKNRIEKAARKVKALEKLKEMPKRIGRLPSNGKMYVRSM